MGRTSTGAITTGEALKLDMSFFIKRHALKRGSVSSTVITWSNQHQQTLASVQAHCSYLEGGPIKITLIYQTPDRQTGEAQVRTDVIRVEAVPSNLGKGEVLYFLCPQTGQRCRILYRCYGSTIWKSRAAYQHRIYYTSQQSSKREYANNRYWQLDKLITRLEGKRSAGTYRGRPTRRAERLKRLESLLEDADRQRWLPETLPLGLRRAIFGKQRR